VTVHPFRRLREYLDNQHERDRFVRSQLARIPAGSRLLDAGAGSQRYRGVAQHLEYRAQDFGKYVEDEKQTLAGGGGVSREPYAYGPIDILSNIWDMPVDDATFDAVLCTEVLEHVPYPIETVRELARVLKPGGRLILTAPSNALRHFDPHFYTSGFSDRWFERVLPENGLVIESIDVIGDYYRWLTVELARSAKQGGIGAKFLLAPALLYLAIRRPSAASTSTLCMGYHVVARRRKTVN